MSTPSDAVDLTFRDIEAGLVALMRQREECVDEYERARSDEFLGPDESERQQLALAAIDQCDLAIDAYLKAEVRKVDGVAAFILREEAKRETVAEEIERLKSLAKMHERRAEYVRKMALRVMQETEQRTIEGARHTLKLKRNPPAVVIAQPELVPDSMKRFTMELTPTEYHILCDFAEVTRVDPRLRKVRSEPRKSAIAAALKARETCPECNGHKGESIPRGPDSAEWIGCPRCGGQGTIPGSVAGCRMEQNERLVIE